MFQLNSYFNSRFKTWIKANYNKKSPIVHRNYDKKIPLKFTDRVKRLTVTFTIINIILYTLFLLVFRCNIIMQVIIIIILYFTTPIVLMISNIINKPIEKYYTNWFINDAKRILNGHKNLKVIGITGSFGKTSVKHFLTELLKSEYETQVMRCCENSGASFYCVKA